MHDFMGKEEYTNTTFFFGQMQKIVMFNWHLMALIRTFITEVFGI